MFDLDFYKGKRVLVTGHTGFKGSWLCAMLLYAGADITGYSLEPPTEPNLFNLSHIDKQIRSVIGDVRDFDHLYHTFMECRPEIVFHLAAQPIVRISYQIPRETYETNVMGTVNIMECARLSDCVHSLVNVTTDKVYLNSEQDRGFVEEDPLDGFDPYSNSKSCSELVTHAYRNSFFGNNGVPVSTARAGNVIGGGDFAPDRILPDCFRAVSKGQKIAVRNPFSIRPYQHVLEPLSVYMMIAEKQYNNIDISGYYNVGPDPCDCLKTGELVDMFCRYWDDGAAWVNISEEKAPHEAAYLKLDCTKLKNTFGWSPVWHIDRAVEMTVNFDKVLMNKGDIAGEMNKEIGLFLGER